MYLMYRSYTIFVTFKTFNRKCIKIKFFMKDEIYIVFLKNNLK